MARFMRLAGKRDYAELHRWSVEHAEDFWELVWKFGEVRGEPGLRRLINAERMPGAQWFPGGDSSISPRTCCASAMPRSPSRFWGEDKVKRQLSRRQLYDLVSRLAQALAAAGVKKGDRVAGYLPNLPESVAAMLATASLGAIWSSCSPDFGVQGVLDRFGQIEPKVLFCADGYLYGGKEFDHAAKNAEILAQAAQRGAQRGAAVPARTPVRRGRRISSRRSHRGEIAFERVEFNHPLYILYSSGTTGRAEVHRARHRRHAAAAPEGAPPAQRRAGRAIACSTSPRWAG